MPTKMRTIIDGDPSFFIGSWGQSLVHSRFIGKAAESIRNLTVDAARLGLESRSNVHGHVLERAVLHTSAGTRACATHTKGGVEHGRLCELSRVTGLIPVTSRLISIVKVVE